MAIDFTEDLTDGCACEHCLAADGPARRRRAGGKRLGRRLARTAAVVAIGGSSVLGMGSSAFASTAPATTTVSSSADLACPWVQGYDSAEGVYWYQDASTGHWYWTSHQSVYEQKTGSTSSSSAAGTSTPSSSWHSTNPTFTGKAGHDSADNVWWYQSNGAWYWTSHESVYEQHTGTSSATEQTATDSTTSSSGSVSSSDGSAQQAALDYMLSQAGAPYVYGGASPSGWDCSGLVQAAYAQAGVSLPRVASAQYTATTPISASQLQPGDLLFWSGDGSVNGIYHVAMYMGGDQYVAAANPSSGVEISNMSDWITPTFYGHVNA
ncbi:C40 family peptidase [Streptomyces fractus]|uniref:C40 family peptidase n=1 Tax=Streptomyces fractus TaxID=641806 RepID=UPI003CF237CC